MAVFGDGGHRAVSPRLAELAHERGLRVYALNPRDVRHYARAVGQRGKTDRLDALMLARYIDHEHASCIARQPSTGAAAAAAELLRRRATLVRHTTALRQACRTSRRCCKPCCSC